MRLIALVVLGLFVLCLVCGGCGRKLTQEEKTAPPPAGPNEYKGQAPEGAVPQAPRPPRRPH